MRERVMEALTWGEPDYVPWIPKKGHTSRDKAVLDRLLKMGMGISYPTGVVSTESPNVKSEARIEGDYRTTTFETPVGSVSEKRRINLPNDEGERGDSWIVERMIKSPEDYKVVKFIVEDRTYTPSYDGVVARMEEVSDHGIAYAGTGYTPFMQLIVHYMGFKKLVIELRRRREMVEDLMEVMDAKMQEYVKIVAASPIEIVNVGDNIDGVLVNPDLFKRYLIPYYQKYTEILHGGGKIAQSHMDGRLKCLKDLMEETGLDVVQAFTPPPMGDLSIREAMDAWREKLAIWINIPEVIFYREPAGVEDFIHDLLKQGRPGRGMTFGITETVPPHHRDIGYEAVTRAVMKYGRLPTGE
jgi:uroporphyrinogen-III decarboxylase